MGQSWSRHQKAREQIKPKAVNKCIWSPNHDYLISGWNDNIYQIHDIIDHPLDAEKMWSDIMVPIEDINDKLNRVVLLDTNISNKLVAICNEHGDVGLLSENKGFYKLETHGSVEYSKILKFNPSGTLLVLASYFGTICIWNVESRKLATFHDINSIIKDMDWQTDNVCAVTGDYEIGIYKYDVTDCTTKCISQLKGHTGLVNGIQWDETRTYLASRSDDQTVKIWTRQSSTCIKNFQHTGFISDIKWRKNSSSTKLMLAIASYDGTILLWNLFNHQSPICVSIGKPIKIIDFNITGQYLAVGCQNKHVILQIDTLSKIFEYSTPRVLSFAWNKSGNKLAACIQDRGINVYDIETKNFIYLL